MATCFFALEHMQDWKSAAMQVASKSKKYVVFSFPTGRMRAYEKDIGHYRNFKKGEVQEYMESIGYNSIKTINAGFPFHSPISRDLENYAFKFRSEVSNKPISKSIRVFHNIWYILFRYFLSKKLGDLCICLFERN